MSDENWERFIAIGLPFIAFGLFLWGLWWYGNG